MSDTSNLLFVMVVIVGMTLGVFYFATHMKYESKVRECCEGYRQYVLDGQIGGKCVAWTYFQDLQGMGGCGVEDLRDENVEVNE